MLVFFRSIRDLSFSRFSQVFLASGLAILIQSVLVSAAFSTEPEGRFCPTCWDTASARAVAESMAPPPSSDPGCDDFIPQASETESADHSDGLGDCPMVIRRVFVINHLSGNVYAFDVWTEVSLPVSELVTMSPVEQLVTDRIVELRLAWDEFIQGTTVSQSAGLVPLKGSRYSIDELDCPQGTALDAVLYPEIMGDYKELIVAAAVQELPPFDQGQSWVRRLTGVGAHALSFGVSVQWESGGNLVYDFEFGVSEDPNPIVPDRLAFDVELVGETQSGAPMLDIQFNKNISRAAGREVTALEDGSTVTSECAVAKIEEALTEQGHTFHIPPSDPTPSPFPEYVGPGGGFNFCTKTLTAKVNGIPQYTFTIYVPCQQP